VENFARLLKESWTLVEENRERLSGHFYARLFLLDPELRQLFPVQMNGQGDRLLEAIITAIHTVGDPESFDEFLRQLGRDHRKYHVDAEHYATMGVALLDALRSTAGDGWNLEYDQAWRDAYAAIAEKMQAGAAADEDPPFWHGEVLTHERYGPDTAVLTVRALQHPLSWRAGQYLSVEVPRYTRESGGRTRSRTPRTTTTCWSSTSVRPARAGCRARWCAGQSRVTCSGWPRRWGR
jgi:hemoglobin-like flavoprotein